LLYNKGYTTKEVQKLLKEKGIDFVIALGIDDAPAVKETIDKRKNADLFQEELSQNQNIGDRNFFGLMKMEENNTIELKKPTPSDEGVLLLQQILLELIECKRLLDHVRTS